MAGISSPGIGSGLNVTDLVTKLVAAERKPAQTQIDDQRLKLQVETSAMGALKSLLSRLQGSLSALTDGSAFGKRTVESSNSDVFTASGSADAVPGNYRIEVLQTATAQKLTSAAFATDAAVGTGTLTLSVGDASIDLEIGPDNNTLAGIRDAINGAQDNPGVSATIVHAEDGDHMVLTSTATGVENAFGISASGGDGGLQALTWDTASASGGLDLRTAAGDARVKVDGFVTSAPGNVLDGIIEGITLNVAEAAPGEPETLTVARDTEAMQNLVKNFVDAYNSFVQGADQLSSYNPDSKTAGPLLGDSILLSIRSQLSSALGRMSGDTSAELRSLGDIGIKLTVDGTLEMDADKLDETLRAHPAQVAALFGGNGDGYGERLDSLLDSYLGSGGTMDIRSDAMDMRTKHLDQQQARLDTRIASVHDRYLAQFTALDITMAQMQQTSSFLEAQLAGLANIYESDD